MMDGSRLGGKLDEVYGHLVPHAFHARLPRHHKTAGGIPYATIAAHKKSRAILRLVDGLVLRENFFHDINAGIDDVEGANCDGKRGGECEDGTLDNDADDEMIEGRDALRRLTDQCARIQSQLSSLSSMDTKLYSVFTREEVCRMLLRVLDLLCATITEGGKGIPCRSESGDDDERLEEGVSAMEINSAVGKQNADQLGVITLHHEKVGHILDSGKNSGLEEVYRSEENLVANLQPIGAEIFQPFALPLPARHSLLNVALELLGKKKDGLRGASNTAFSLPDGEDDDDVAHQFSLVISYRALLRTLLRTAPYLDEHRSDILPAESGGNRRVVLRKTVNLIKSCRRFFYQGTPDTPTQDLTARQLWQMLQNDLVYHTHSNSTFRALIMLYLFHPSKCSAAYYERVLPTWMDCWRGNIDRCPEADYLWMVILSRARKYLPFTSPYHRVWFSSMRKHLLTSCGYWFQIPVGGVSADKSFPSAKAPNRRWFPARLKVFVGIEDRYEEGMDFYGRLAKLLISCAGHGGTASSAEGGVTEGTVDILRFLRSIAPYYNPSNTGGWTLCLGAFLYYLSYEFCVRVGNMVALRMLKRSQKGRIFERLEKEDPYVQCLELREEDVVALLDVMLPLCQQALYSKNSTVAHAGETSLSYLNQIDPGRIAPPLIDFTLDALDASAVHLSHQAPAALSALSRLLQPALRRSPRIILSRLPDILRLTLAGIDGNDQNKSLRTLIFYRNLCMWVPVGGMTALQEDENETGVSNPYDFVRIGQHLMETRYGFVDTDMYKSAIGSLPLSSVLAVQQSSVASSSTGHSLLSTDSMLMQEAMSCMSDWSLMFLDRVYELLRAAGEQEKLGKGHGGVGAQHTSADVAMAKNFSRILKETLVYFFAAMDDVTYMAALRSVTIFIEEETLPFAMKDASLLCQAVCSARFNIEGSTMDKSPGLDAIVPVLTNDLEHKSDKCAMYRLRCLAGAVRYAGTSVVAHRKSIVSAISFALSKSGRKIIKTGCKLLRHTMSSQCEEYPIAGCLHPVSKLRPGAAQVILGQSPTLSDERIWWHTPSGKQIDFTVSLLSQFALTRWAELGSPGRCNKGKTSGCVAVNEVHLKQWRQALRVLRYSFRGCSGLLLDQDPETIVSQAEDDAELFCPREVATAKLLLSSSAKTQTIVRGLRRRICSNLLDITSLIAQDATNYRCGDNAVRHTKNETGVISADAKICGEVIQLAELVLTRRGAQYKWFNKKMIWQGQKEILLDYVSTSATDYISSVLSRCNIGIRNCYYKDGEGSGKTLPRALIVNRVHLSSMALTDGAPVQVLRRLRRLRGGPRVKVPESLFSFEMTLQKLFERIRSDDEPSYDDAPRQTSLEIYESLVDGLCALSCHPNINVRGDALSVTEKAFSRLGWIVKHRTSRLCNAILLDDENQWEMFGIPSCARLVNHINDQGKRSRFAEVVKGVLKMMGFPKVMKEFSWGAGGRFELVRTLTGTQRLLKLLPPEEVPKVVHYINSIFLSYRSRHFVLPRSSAGERATHEACLAFLIGVLCDGDNSALPAACAERIIEDEHTQEMHWRDRLVAAWFVLQFVDEQDVISGDPKVMSRVWSTCSALIEEEEGQPLQRVSLGLLGRLVSLALVDMPHISGRREATESIRADLSELRSMFATKKFCKAFGNALVFDHREDSSVGGGHSAQWSGGVEDILRDATSNLAPKTLFPFNRIGQKSHTFKLAHSQLIESILLAIGHDNAKEASRLLMEQADELVTSPPSEDQRNQLCTSAEIFGGVARALIWYDLTEQERNYTWENILLPFLDDAIVKVPTNLLSAFFDACRYAIHHFPPQFFYPLLRWSVAKVEGTLWQHEAFESNDRVEDTNSGAATSSAMADRFALQGKWLLFVQAVLAELDCEGDLGAACKPPWYCCGDLLVSERNDAIPVTENIELGRSWEHVNERLTPCLLNAVGHPYEKCRDHIASCLFRICYCHRKFTNTFQAAYGNKICSVGGGPGGRIIKELSSIRDSGLYQYKEKHRALGTARKFVACCIHWGDARHEYPEFIIPMLSAAFQSLQSVDQGGMSPDYHGIEADLVKGYRYAIADISLSCIACYGVSQDITRVLNVLKEMSSQESHWQIRQATAHFLRCFQGSHKFLFTKVQSDMALSIAVSLLADDRREVSSAAMSTLTGILAVFSKDALEELVSKYIHIANKSLKKKRRKTQSSENLSLDEIETTLSREKQRSLRQQTSVAFLAAAVLCSPYDTPTYIPKALAALSRHSFEQRASLNVREVVKMVCREFKRTHTDNWEAHKRQFTREQLEALEDVVSTPHYYS